MKDSELGVGMSGDVSLSAMRSPSSIFPRLPQAKAAESGGPHELDSSPASSKGLCARAGGAGGAGGIGDRGD
jgi:hypothetical protein